MPSDVELQAQGKQTHDLRHCDDPGCCVGSLMGRCQRCGFIVLVGTVCPATEDAKPLGFKLERYSLAINTTIPVKKDGKL